MRIVSLQPTGTEMAFALGLGRSVVGVSHECDFPRAALRRPRVTRSSIDPAHMSSTQIDAAVREAARTGASLYEIDVERVRSLRPDLLILQSLCEVCAVAPPDTKRLLTDLRPKPRVIVQHAHDFETMFRDLRELADAAGADAGPLERRLRARIEAVVSRTRDLAPRNVFLLEWLDPPFASGHWVPEMTAMAGGRDLLARPKEPSRRIEWADLAAAAPEKVVLIPCGFDLERTKREMAVVTGRPEWRGLPAVRAGEVWLADGHSYFNGAGPRLVDGLEILAEIFHPEVFPRRHRKGTERWSPPTTSSRTTSSNAASTGRASRSAGSARRRAAKSAPARRT